MYEFQRYSVVRGSGGTYATAGILGSRPGGIVAAAWATMRYLGVDGYTRIATAVARNAQILSDAVADIEGVEMLCRSEAGILVIKGSPGYRCQRWWKPCGGMAAPRTGHRHHLWVATSNDLRAAVADCVAGNVRDHGSRVVFSKDWPRW